MTLYTICIDNQPSVVIEASSVPEVKEAIDGWLGERISAATLAGSKIWPKGISEVQIRPAGLDEEAIWNQSMDDAVLGHPFNEAKLWPAFLVDMDDPVP